MKLLTMQFSPEWHWGKIFSSACCSWTPSVIKVFLFINWCTRELL